MNYQELPKLRDSISYLYFEHAILERDENAIIAISKEGRIPIPISGVTCLLLGPGTSVTHAAIRIMSEHGCMVIWCGEEIGRFYAAGLGETRSAANVLAQARACMDDSLHMAAVREMYAIRFPGVDTSKMTLQQIRGMEGIRVKKAYALAAKSAGVQWKKRTYKRDEWEKTDPVNRALSIGNALLYGVCHSAIVSLGFSPALGFVHTGKQLSFVYDIADLYKTETTIPAAFEAVSKNDGKENLDREVRTICRKYFHRINLLSRIPDDIFRILKVTPDDQPNDIDAGTLWDDDKGTVDGGYSFAESLGGLE